MVKIAHELCSLCRKDSQLTSGIGNFAYNSLVAAPHGVDVTITELLYGESPQPKRTNHGSYPVIGFAVVSYFVRDDSGYREDETIEPVFLYNGIVTNPRVFEVSQHDHDDTERNTFSFVVAVDT
ncbi:MAG TPA: hypothetical protein VGR71_16755 [Nitrospira sp.]|nr:hypothetical protein [Nitrospira sp.]